MDLDAKLSSHPIEVECPDAEMVNQIFDDLSYSKAASVLRMLSNYVGEERFLKGVSIYLKKHLFANSVTKDLWEGIGAATGIDISKMMDNWVKTVGYPVVKVTETREGVHIRQDRFLETGPAKPEDNETLWTIPLALLTTKANGETVLQSDIVLDEREKTIPLDVTRPFKLNAGTVGFYRVLYTPERLLKIAKEAVKTPSPFSVEDRMGLVYDAMVLSKAGYSEVSSALALVDILRDEPERERRVPRCLWRYSSSLYVFIRSRVDQHPEQPCAPALCLVRLPRRQGLAGAVQSGAVWPHRETAGIRVHRRRALGHSRIAHASYQRRCDCGGAERCQGAHWALRALHEDW